MAPRSIAAVTLVVVLAGSASPARADWQLVIPFWADPARPPKWEAASGYPSSTGCEEARQRLLREAERMEEVARERVSEPLPSPARPEWAGVDRKLAADIAGQNLVGARLWANQVRASRCEAR